MDISVPFRTIGGFLTFVIVLNSAQIYGLNVTNYLKVNGCGMNGTVFMCDPTSNSSKCITTDKYMDCVKDCPNGADEMCADNFTKCDKCKCVAPSTIKNKCYDYNVPVCNLGNTWACATGGQCILNTWVWDGVADCNDGSDEDPTFVNQCMFPGAFYCPNNSVCTWTRGKPYTCQCNKGWIYAPATQTCEIDLDSRLPGSCSAYPLQIQCGDGKCVNFTKFRDCVSDCNDGADEACYPGFVKCDGCKCVDPKQAKYVCFDYINQKVCNSSTVYDIFKCPDGRCLLGSWVMDGDKDCPGGEDENPCYLGLSDCPTTPPPTTPTTPTTTPTPTTTTTTTTPTTTPTTTTTTTTPTTTTSTTTTTTPTTTPTTTTTTPTTTTSTTTTTPTTTPTTTTTTPTTTTTTPTTTTITTTPTTTPTTTTTTTTPTTTTTTTTPTTTTTTTTPTTTPTTTTTTPTTTTSTTTTTTTTTTPTTTARTQQLTANQVTIGFIVDATVSVQSVRTLIGNGIKNASGQFAAVEAQRVYSYLLVGYTDTAASVITEKYYYKDFGPAVDAWVASNATALAAGQKCPNGVLMGVQTALNRSTPRCELYIFVNSAPNNVTRDTLMDGITAVLKQCHLNFIVVDSPCMSIMPSNSMMMLTYQTFADLTGGLLLTLDNVTITTNLLTIYYYLGYDAVQPRITLDYGSRTLTNSSYMTSFVVDPQLSELSVCVTGCGPAVAFIRDNRGFGLQLGRDYSMAVNYTGGVCVLIPTLSTAVSYKQYGPGMWVVTINSMCPIRYRIDAAGQVEYSFQWMHSTTAARLITPVLGVSELVMASPIDPKAPVYSTTLMHYVTLEGVTSATSSMGVNMMTEHAILAPGGLFYVKIHGFDAMGMMFQRFSRSGYAALPFVNQRQLSSATCPNKLDCYGNGTCQDLSTRGECMYQCPNGMDEGCMEGYFKCFCTCLPIGRECVDPSLAKMCSQTDTTLFNCVETTPGRKQTCLPIKWAGDGESDCMNNSDEDPATLNECNPIRKLALCDKPSNASCTNLPQASYYCTCPTGLWGDGIFCLGMPTSPAMTNATTTTSTSTSTSTTSTTRPPTTAAPNTTMAAPNTTTAAPNTTTAAPNTTTAAPNTTTSTTTTSTTTASTTTTSTTTTRPPTTAAPNTTTAAPNTTLAPTTVANTTTAAPNTTTPPPTTTTTRPSSPPPPLPTTLIPTPGPLDPVIRAIYFSTCGIGTFQCTDGKCIQFAQHLDCKQDCSDGLDEKCTAGYTKCDGCKCVLPSNVGTACTDAKLQTTCTQGAPGIFPCKDGSGCVYYQWAMDGVRDCKDGSDENPLYWNECLLGTDICDRVHGTCNDDIGKPLTTSGSPVCECSFGFYSTDNGHTCQPLANATTTNLGRRRRRRTALVDPPPQYTYLD